MNDKITESERFAQVSSQIIARARSIQKRCNGCGDSVVELVDGKCRLCQIDAATIFRDGLAACEALRETK